MPLPPQLTLPHRPAPAPEASPVLLVPLGAEFLHLTANHTALRHQA